MAPEVLTGAEPLPPDLDRTVRTLERTRPVGRYATADVDPRTHRGQGARCGHPRTLPTAAATVATCEGARFEHAIPEGPDQRATAGSEAAEVAGLRASTRRCTSAGTRSSARSNRLGVLDPTVAQVVGPFGQARRDAVPIRAVQPQVLCRLPASVPARPAVTEVRAGTPHSVSAPAGSPVSRPQAQRPQHGEDRIRIGEGQLLDEVVLVVVAEAMSRDGLSDGGRSCGQPGGGADSRYLGAATNPGLP